MTGLESEECDSLDHRFEDQRWTSLRPKTEVVREFGSFLYVNGLRIYEILNHRKEDCSLEYDPSSVQEAMDYALAVTRRSWQKELDTRLKDLQFPKTRLKRLFYKFLWTEKAKQHRDILRAQQKAIDDLQKKLAELSYADIIIKWLPDQIRIQKPLDLGDTIFELDFSSRQSSGIKIHEHVVTSRSVQFRECRNDIDYIATSTNLTGKPTSLGFYHSMIQSDGEIRIGGLQHSSKYFRSREQALAFLEDLS